MADLEGWLLATQILRATPAARAMFDQLEAVSFGNWDDGRWSHYLKKAGRYVPEIHDEDEIPYFEFRQQSLYTSVVIRN